MNNNPLDPNLEEEENINLRQVIDEYLRYWKWFILCILLALIGAVVYLKYTQKQYQVTAKIILNEKENSTGELAALIDSNPFSGGNSNGKIGDQIEVLKSRRLIAKVISHNNLNVIYQTIGKIKNTQLAESESPIKFIFLNQEDKFKDDLKGNFDVKILSSTKFQLIDSKTESTTTYSFGQKIKADFGDFIISPNTPNIAKYINKNILINLTSIENLVSSYQSKTQISPNNEKTSNIINFSQTSATPKISELFINQLIDQYKNDLIEDNSKLVKATTLFINERLAEVSNNLTDVDKNLQSFKISNNLTDIAAEANLYLQNASENEKKLLDFSTQLQLVDYMSNSLSSNKSDLLPSNIGLQDQTISSQINSYNQLVLTKDDMLKSVTLNHPNVITLDEQINEIRKNLKSSLKLYRNNVQTNLNSIRGKLDDITGRISKFPQQETGFKNISREQKIVESLYLFLLEKREENEIKASSTPEHIKVIDAAFTNKNPVSPKRNIIFLGAIIIGLIIPFAIIYIYKLLDNRITSKEEVEAILKIPVAGQIPTSDTSILRHNDSSTTAEAFRMLRTNINFFLSTNSSNKGKSIFITSTVSSEGKSFSAVNLSQILAMSGKKVLLIGADIRNPKILDHLEIKSKYKSHPGLTEYLVSDEISFDQLVIKNPANYRFDIISSGQIAPNPSELLMNGRFKNVIDYGKDNYDFVIVDTAPVGLVTDTLLITDYADLTLYVIRANFVDKRLLFIPKDLHKEKRIKNIALVVNDVKLSSGYYYNYNYGYGYGYNLNLNKRPWYKKIFSKNK